MTAFTYKKKEMELKKYILKNVTTLLTFCQLLIVGSSSSVVLPWLLSWPQTHVGYDDGIRSVATGVEDERSQKTKHLQCGDRKNIDGWF